MPGAADIAARLDAVRARMRAAADRAGPDPATLTLVAVSKTFPAARVRDAAGAGARHFGENRVQEGLAKMAAPDVAGLDLEWHLIGHLQSNKVRKAAESFAWVQSVDRLDLLRKLDEAASAAGRTINVLIQIDLAHEATKSGADEGGVEPLARAALDARALRLRGLMTIPPMPEHPESSRPWFGRLRRLRDALVDRGVPAASLTELSMGMSDDFEVAIEEGATIVRVGSAIFGRRVAGPSG